MIRKAFKMKIYSNAIEEYKRRHNPIWEELKIVLKENGVVNYSIFLDSETGMLYGYAEVSSEEEWAQIAKTEICKKWWKSMAHLMETNSDNSPKSEDLEEVFYLD